MIEKIKAFCERAKMPAPEANAHLDGPMANHWFGFCEGQLDMAKRILQLIAENEPSETQAV